MTRLDHLAAEGSTALSALVRNLAAPRKEGTRTLRRATEARWPSLWTLVLLIGFWSTGAGAQTCGDTYLAQGRPTRLIEVDTSTSPFTYNELGVADVGYNAMAYRPTDDTLYAIQLGTNMLLRVNFDGSVDSLGEVADLPKLLRYNTGGFAPDGFMYVTATAGDNFGNLHRINVDTLTATEVPLSPQANISDVAWFDGLFYTVGNRGGPLQSIDPDTGTVTTIGATGVTGTTFGAMLGASNGVFGVANNGSGFFRFDPATGEATLISDAPGSSNNDGARCLEAPLELAPLAPATLEVDFTPLDSDGNDVFEPGERVEMAPGWRNDGIVDVSADGILSNFVGPEGGTYEIVANGVGYGPIVPGEIESCRDSGTACHQLDIQMTGGDRPAQHWDATVDEELQTGPGDLFSHNWTLHVGDSFEDVPRNHLFYSWIETLTHNEVTAGCTSTEYCPGSPNTRGQMAVFVLKSFEGPEYAPPACEAGTGPFDDVPPDHLFCAWIEELARRGVVAGCDADSYCPGDAVSRAQMSVFLLKTLEGSDYVPPECTGIYTDVTCPSLFADWIEDLATREITAGCTPTEYCPGEPQTRGQMAVFLTKTFGLLLYGP